MWHGYYIKISKVKMNNCKLFCMNVIRSFDFFSQPITLRYKKQPQYQSVLGGLLSIILMIFFIGIFFNTLLFTFQKKLISSKTDEFEELDPSSFDIDTSQFTFGISIHGINFADNKRYFDIKFHERTNNNQGKLKKQFPLQFCTKQQWEVHGKQFGQFYDRSQMRNWLCPTPGLIMNVAGKYSSQLFKFWQLTLSKCRNQTDPSRPCATTEQINALITETKTLEFNFYYINSILNPSSEVYQAKYLQDRNYFILSSNRIVTANLFVSSYEIETDQSILPFQDPFQQSGVIVRQPAQTFYQQSSIDNQDYIKFYIRKSSISLDISRNFQKLDDTLSYIGGLFSSLITFLFFMNMYNQYSYEYSLASDLFKSKSEQHIDANNFHFFRFIGFIFYEALTKIGIYLPWQSMQQTQSILQESRSQMDIRLLMQKALFAQRTIQILMQKQQLDLLHFQQPKTIEQMERDRLKYKNYRDKIKKKILENKNVFGESEASNDLEISQNGKPVKYTIEVNEMNFANLNSVSELDQHIDSQNRETSYKTRKNHIDNQIRDTSHKTRKNHTQKKENDFLHLAFRQVEKLLVGSEKQKQQKISQKMEENMNYLESQVKIGDKISSKLYQNLSPELKNAYQRKKKKRQLSIRQITSQIPSHQNDEIP